MVSVKHWARRGMRHVAKRAKSYASSALAGYLGHSTGSMFSNPTSGSRTLTRNRAFQNDTSEMHSEISSKYLSSTLGHPYNKRCMGSALLRYGEVVQFLGETPTGVQNVETILTFASVSQMVVGESEGVTVAPTSIQGGLGLMDINPSARNSGSNYITAAQIPRNDQLFLSNVKLIIDFANLSTAGLLLDLYLVTPKVNTNLTPSQVWQNGLDSDAMGQSLAAAPVAGVVASAVGTPLIASPVLTPETCNHFKKHYQIIGKYSTNLAGGSTETVNWNVNTNYTMDLNKIKNAQNFTSTGTVVTNANITNNFLRKGTCHVMAVYRGAACLNLSAAEAGVPFMTYSKVKLGFVMQKKYTMKMIAGNASRLAVQSVGQFIPIGTGINKIIDVLDDPVSVEVVT